MSNLEKYDNAFIESLDVSANDLPCLTYQQITSWDSVGHMGLINALETAFDIMLETDDIIDLSSYEQGKEIVRKYGVEL